MMTAHADYIEFLNGKVAKAQKAGLEIDVSEINPMLKQHQRDIVKWAVNGGQRAKIYRISGKVL